MGEPEEAVLVLRMGGDMRWSVIVACKSMSVQVQDGEMRPVPILEALYEQLAFAKSSVPVAADGSNLSPGYGGWTDRGMTKDEPGRVVANIDRFFLDQAVLWGNGSTIGGGATVFGDNALSFQNKELFAVRVMRPASLEFARVKGSKTIYPWPPSTGRDDGPGRGRRVRRS